MDRETDRRPLARKWHPALVYADERQMEAARGMKWRKMQLWFMPTSANLMIKIGYDIEMIQQAYITSDLVHWIIERDVHYNLKMGQNKKRKNEETEVGNKDLNRASWSKEALHIFCDMCIRHIVWTKGRKGAMISPRLPWKVVVADFQKKTNLGYDKDKLKHKWDWMRIKWSLWKALKGEDTGLCWDPVKGTINASDEWWDKKIQENVYFKSFRDEGIEPELESKMEQLFKGPVSLGVDGSPVMDFAENVLNEVETVCMPSPQNLKVGNESYDFGEEKSENSSFNIELEEVSNNCSPVLSPIPLRSTAGIEERGSERVFENEKGASENNKISESEIATAEVLMEKLDSLVKVANKRIKDMESINCEARKHAVSSYSLEDSLAKLVSLPGLIPGSHEFCFACTLIEDPQKRTILHGIPDDNSRLQWIKFLYEDYRNR